MNVGSELPRQRAPWWRRHWIVIVIAVLLFGLAADALWVEPENIEVTQYEIQSAEVKSPLKIVQLSDLHTRGMGRPERKMLAILAREKPDVILITGDTLADPFGNYQESLKVYRQLHAPLGVWFVHGNWEDIRPVRHERQFYRDAGIRLLVNQNHELRPDVWVAGLDDPYSGVANLNAALKGIPKDVYTILMFHSPAYFDQAAGHVNLCLAGHTHGGQVRIPFVKPFWLPVGSGRFLEGWYEEKNSRMYVNRGMGMSNLPVRFLCRPEITFITLEP
ncbi:MAG TPA: metallophosphoesterase [Candidatus Acidoferrales bacterium]|nr:metallophosphoesterase [Candidatus Acidoferrales bacterium]